jgi:hypothetical protein
MVIKSKIYDVQVKCDDCGEIADPEPPENRRYYTGGMALVLGFIGFLIGSVFGIATAGVSGVGLWLVVWGRRGGTGRWCELSPLWERVLVQPGSIGASSVE